MVNGWPYGTLGVTSAFTYARDIVARAIVVVVLIDLPHQSRGGQPP